MKGYISIREMSRKWSMSERRVNQYCAEGSIPGAERFGKSWSIPADAKKQQGEKASCRKGEAS